MLRPGAALERDGAPDGVIGSSDGAILWKIKEGGPFDGDEKPVGWEMNWGYLEVCFLMKCEKPILP